MGKEEEKKKLNHIEKKRKRKDEGKEKKTKKHRKSKNDSIKKKKKSKQKKEKKHGCSDDPKNIDVVPSSFSSSSESDSESPSHFKQMRVKSHWMEREKKGSKSNEPDFEVAARIIKSILLDDSKAMGDILDLLHMLDSGECVVIEGLQNETMKSRLTSLFVSLALQKNKNDESTSYSKPEEMSIPILECIQNQLMNACTNDLVPEKEVKLKRSIGPSLPSSNHIMQAQLQLDEEEEDEMVGPSLPGMRGYREADPDIVAEMEAKKRLQEEKQWNQIKGKVDDSTGCVEREEWMTSLPESKSLLDTLGGLGDTKTRQFTNKEKVEIDNTWFSTPQERAEAVRQKEEIELLGFSRSGKTSTSSVGPSTSLSGPKTADSSIVPVANLEADEKMKETMQVMRAMRGKSLVEIHQEKVAAKKQEQNSTSSWNRDRDLTSSRQMNSTQANELLKNARSINSRFSTPCTTRQFL